MKNGDVSRKAAPTRPKRKSKYEELIHVDATPEEIAQTIFMGKPKPRDQWRYLKRDKES